MSSERRVPLGLTAQRTAATLRMGAFADPTLGIGRCWTCGATGNVFEGWDDDCAVALVCRPCQVANVWDVERHRDEADDPWEDTSP